MATANSDNHPSFFWRFSGVVLLCLVITVGLGVGVRVASVFTPAPIGPDHSEILTVLMTGLTISIAVLAIVIAGLAVWGYGAIRTEAREIATMRAKEAAEKYLASDEMQQRLRKLAEKATEGVLTMDREGAELAYSQPLDRPIRIDATGETKPVANPYPKGKGGDHEQ